jgi:hypothetical protein
MGSAPSPPPAPTPQSQLLNQNTAFGSTNYSPGPNGTMTATSNNTALQPGIATNVNAFNNETPLDAQNMVSQSLKLGQNYLDPYFKQQQSQLQAQLQNQGFDPASAGAQFQTNSLRDEQTRALGGMLPGLESAASTAYQMPLQAALTAGNPANTQIPGAQGALSNAVNTTTQAQQYDYGQQMQNYDAMMGGLFSIPSTALGGWAAGGGINRLMQPSNWNSSLPSGNFTGF